MPIEGAMVIQTILVGLVILMAIHLPMPAINPGAGSIKSSTVYCYTGDTLDKTVVYDGSGVGKEQ